MAYQNLSNPIYSQDAAPQTGPMKIFSDMVHSYLDLVQRNVFPPAFLEELLRTRNTDALKNNVKEILNYEVGYLVGLAIGALFIILMTLVGLFFACCRCCGNCGGKMYQKQSKGMTCKRRFMYLFLLIITLVILAGDICAFYSNSKIDNSVNNSFNSFDDTLGNLKTYLNTVPKDVDIIINSSSVPIGQANSSITGIGPVLGGMIQKSIENTANKTLNDVQNMVTFLNNTAKALVNVNDTFNTLRSSQDQLVQNLTNVRNQINKTVTDCGPSCNSSTLPLSDLAIDANFDSIPNFSDQQKSLNDFLNSGIDGTLQDARKILNDIPQTVINQTKTQVQDVQDQLVKIRQKIQDVRQSINIVDKLDTFNSYFDTAANYSRQYKPDIIKYEYYRWIVGICLCCIILLVVVCNLLGLLFGPCGHKSNVDPTERNCASNCGGEFFMAGAGFSFIFAWLLMLITAILFLVGGNVHTSLCKPWSTQQLYQVLDSLNLSKELNISGLNLNIANIYRDCQSNSPLWSTLNLSNLYNLDSYLDISQYTADVNKTLENTKINLNNITFLSDDQKSKVTSVNNSGINTLDFKNITQQSTKNITKTDLRSFASQLTTMANQSTLSDTTKNELNNEAQTLLNLQTIIDNNVLPQVKNLNSSIISLQEQSKQLPKNLTDTLASIQAAQTFVDTQVVGIVKNEIRSFLQTILGYFETYIDWVKRMLTTNMARCAPVAGALRSAEVVACQYIVDTFNAFWFSIGWCTIFFIPSIILSVKLAKHYRRMKTSDVYETPNDHLEMTTTSQQFLIPRVTAKS